jgi:DNA polymerase III psi subunit
VTVLLNKLFEEYENVQKKLIVAIMSSTTLTNGEFSGQSSSIDEVKLLDDIIDMNSKLIINFTSNKIKIASKIQVINSDSIDELTADPQKKKQLWASIKKMLNL